MWRMALAVPRPVPRLPLRYDEPEAEGFPCLGAVRKLRRSDMTKWPRVPRNAGHGLDGPRNLALRGHGIRVTLLHEGRQAEEPTLVEQVVSRHWNWPASPRSAKDRPREASPIRPTGNHDESGPSGPTCVSIRLSPSTKRSGSGRLVETDIKRS